MFDEAAECFSTFDNASTKDSSDSADDKPKVRLDAFGQGSDGNVFSESNEPGKNAPSLYAGDGDEPAHEADHDFDHAGEGSTSITTLAQNSSTSDVPFRPLQQIKRPPGSL